MEVTKRKEGEGRYGPVYRVLIDGKPTPFTVAKDIPPRFGQRQAWDVIEEGDEMHDLLFTTKSLESALAVIASIVRAARVDA